MSPESRAARVRFLFLDVDGTMTNGRLYRSDNGDLWRAYHVLDGYGLRRLIKNGCPAAIVTAAAGGDSIVLRMQELGINRIHQGVDDKLQTVKNILAEENIAADAAAYMGDDLPDLQANAICRLGLCAAKRYAGGFGGRALCAATSGRRRCTS